MHHITTGSSLVRSAHARVAAGLIGAGLYVVGGGLLLAYLLAQGAGPTDQSAAAETSVIPFVQASAAQRTDRGSTSVVPLIVSVVGGPTFHCLAAAHLFSADAIMVTTRELAGMSGVLDCHYDDH
jgi:hypothetical protein